MTNVVFDEVRPKVLCIKAVIERQGPSTKNVSPGYFHRKIEPKEILAVLFIPRLLVVFTWQLKNLVTALCTHMKLIIDHCRLQGVKKERLLVVYVCPVCCGSQNSKNVLFCSIMISLQKSTLT